ncbi:hypothetical protein J6590_000831 [Homalodisca vitripennis]|nr:hypothetical protein J6590_000831 [Homalodisca vitripennis]
MWKCVKVLLVFIIVAGNSSADEKLENVLQKPQDSVLEEKPVNVSGYNDNQVWKKCYDHFTSRCVKMSLTRMVNRLEKLGVQIAPGITLRADTSRASELQEVLWKLLTPESHGVLLLHRLKKFLSSLSVKVELEDPALLKRVKTLTEEVVDGLVNDEETGRKKGGGGALLWSAGSLAAVGFASLAAMAGKAMMASLMALMLAGLTVMRGSGGGGGGGGGHKSHVEIIKAPAHIELAPAPHFEAGSHAFEHDHYYTAPGGYEYGRMMSVDLAKVDSTARTTNSPR